MINPISELSKKYKLDRKRVVNCHKKWKVSIIELDFRLYKLQKISDEYNIPYDKLVSVAMRRNQTPDETRLFLGALQRKKDLSQQLGISTFQLKKQLDKFENEENVIAYYQHVDYLAKNVIRSHLSVTSQLTRWGLSLDEILSLTPAQYIEKTTLTVSTVDGTIELT